MENYYFPLFLVVLAAVVVWIFMRTSSRRRASGGRASKSPAGRTASAGRLHRNLDRTGPASLRKPPASPKRQDIWQTRRQRAAHDSFVETTARRGVHYAGYVGPYAEAEPTYGRNELRDQNISRDEHLSIDEYLSKQEEEKAAREAEKQSGFTMTAMKYEPASETSAKEDKEPKKQAGFKP